MSTNLDERVYTVRDVAKLTGFTRWTVARLFEKERGVIILETSGRRNIRIPHAVYLRVIRRITVQ
jgi:AraC-like DNA-binding protein